MANWAAGRVIALLGACASEREALAAALADRLQREGNAVTLLTDALAIEAARQRPALVLLLAIEATPASPADSDTQASDARLRQWLFGAGLPFSVIHGAPEQRLTNALNTIRAALPGGGVMDDGDQQACAPAAQRGSWAWSCDKCSDPACEHQLFTRLMAARGAGAAS